MNTFEDFKNQVAVKHGHPSFEVMFKRMIRDTEFDGILSRLEEATTLFVESERKRIWDKACEEQKRFTVGLLYTRNEQRYMLEKSPLVKYDPTN